MVRVCQYEKDRLPLVLDQLLGEQRIIGRHPAVVVRSGNVAVGQHIDHTRVRTHRCKIDRAQARMRIGRYAEGRMQRPGRLRRIIDVTRRAGDLQMGRLVAQRGADPTRGAGNASTSGRVHQ